MPAPRAPFLGPSRNQEARPSVTNIAITGEMNAPGGVG
jgi:hypothetical protein